MKFTDILTSLKPFAGVAAAMIPGGPAALALVNAFLPENERLPETATGGEIQSAVDKLPPAARASLLEKEVDLKIAQEEGWTERYKAMCSGDGQETRARIALMMAYILSFEILAFTVHIFMGGVSADMWVVFGTLTAIPAGVLGKYFGDLRREQNARVGLPSVGGIVQKLLG